MSFPNPRFYERFIKDIRHVLGHFPTRNLVRLRAEVRQGGVIRHTYTDDDGRGCVLNVLSRGMPPGMQITDKPSLVRFFTGGFSAAHMGLPEYQPAKYLVKIWDGNPEAIERYGTAVPLSEEVLIEILNQVIRERIALHEQERQVRTRALERLQTRSARVDNGTRMSNPEGI